MTETVNLGRMAQGQAPDGWDLSLLSPFEKVLSEDEFANKRAVEFGELSNEEQQIILADFKAYLSLLGGDYFLYDSYSDAETPPLDEQTLDEQTYFEVLMDPNIRSDGLENLLGPFLEDEIQTSVFHLNQQCFINFGWHMSIWFIHKAPLPSAAGLKLLKLIDI